ncbi:hypothetical protein TbgDal_III5090 [Trypanosoma brucei gambiense DAL972]|uniref:Uncharacterized protein n=1 Tax=Trypanosoma brucei gambiense (strain MHOM/CI/86/DAL972) TaxID=679716 RepID=C9ZLF8_TRYB9|nr:hypothetical protein TbgDal_III5090 [Trypanosoma brucei gambiense DAL972]CBH10167.1 hypothetical protein TbgDal_III5090 [Trypanosoma brucei gambiense DAL972]|eukprot:XP_011772457.1 hypothetical protein TbgDal_III5090 [Trypanosoma brucei gambiense DAL972]
MCVLRFIRVMFPMYSCCFFLVFFRFFFVATVVTFEPCGSGITFRYLALCCVQACARIFDSHFRVAFVFCVSFHPRVELFSFFFFLKCCGGVGHWSGGNLSFFVTFPRFSPFIVFITIITNDVGVRDSSTEHFSRFFFFSCCWFRFRSLYSFFLTAVVTSHALLSWNPNRAMWEGENKREYV